MESFYYTLALSTVEEAGVFLVRVMAFGIHDIKSIIHYHRLTFTMASRNCEIVSCSQKIMMVKRGKGNETKTNAGPRKNEHLEEHSPGNLQQLYCVIKSRIRFL